MSRTPVQRPRGPAWGCSNSPITRIRIETTLRGRTPGNGLWESPVPAKNSSAAVSIFDGTDQIIHDALGLQPGQSLKQISTCRKLCDAPPPATFSPGIVPLLFERMVGNWHGRIPSSKNWRHERRTAISDENRSPEVVLERAIVTLAELGDLPEWYNQIPVASGLADGRSDKRAALDLARITGDTAELIELKWASDTPLFALFEVVRYGLALLLGRQNARAFGYSGRPLIEAPVLKLVVLAPALYYHGCDVRGFADIATRGLSQLGRAHSDFPDMSLEFLRFPIAFEPPVRNGAEVNAMRSGSETSGRLRLLEAISSLRPAWEVGQ